MRGLNKQENNRKTNNRQKKIPAYAGKSYRFFQLDRTLLGGFPVKSEAMLI